ncbi:MAG: hypothetical protein A2Y36_13325 [Treponema sp. GWA1_62_8]|nr:MAG: hypothetical protein A2Y36_13325 [Treponema sp. GWA1_62_8]OHE64586.1 MAG: hypothetical protein A2001_00215 [Treponema sp. GWC1_61_84]
MTRLFFLLLALDLGAGLAVGDTWDTLLADRMESSIAFRDAKIKLEQAELKYVQLSEPFRPTLSTRTVEKNAFAIRNGEFTGGTVETGLSLSGLFGTDLSMTAPLVVSADGSVAAGNPSLALSRKLFTETSADRLSAEAALLKARILLRDAEASIRIQLATDLLNAVYFSRRLDADRRYLAVMERDGAAAAEASRRDAEKKILEARKAFLSSSVALKAYDSAIIEAAESEYPGVLARTSALATAPIDVIAAPPSSAAIRAQELELAAAEKRKAFSALPYLPNPGMAAVISYDLEGAKVDWGLTLQLSFDLLAKGERELDARLRKENAVLERLRLTAAIKTLSDGIRSIRDRLEILELDRTLKALDLEDAAAEAARGEALFDGGFINEETLEIGRIELSIARLDAMKTDHDILIQRLNLARFYDAE